MCVAFKSETSSYIENSNVGNIIDLFHDSVISDVHSYFHRSIMIELTDHVRFMFSLIFIYNEYIISTT